MLASVEVQEGRIGIQAQAEAMPEREFLITAHGDQPHRLIFRPSSPNQPLDVFESINDEIYDEVYGPVLEKRDYMPDRIVFSLYASLRDWMKYRRSGAFAKIKENIGKMRHKEQQVLGDTYIHAIMPLLSEQDQDTLTKIGKKAFVDDLGFEPEGIWLPETAVSSTTLRVLHENGYKFVVLRDDQLESSEENPIYVPVRKDGSQIGEMAVVHFVEQTSKRVSFEDDYTKSAEHFLGNARSYPKRVISIATDMEFFGHHKKGKDQFLDWTTHPDALKMNGFRPFDVNEALKKLDKKFTEIKENSSWSCGHGIARWTGFSETCNCSEHPMFPLTEERKAEKRHYLGSLSALGQEIDKRLDQLDTAWRDKFVNFFLGVRESVFRGKDPIPDIEKMAGDSDLMVLRDSEVRNLFLGKMYYLIAMTSCGWFFANSNSETNAIPRVLTPEVRTLINTSRATELPQAA